MNSKNLPTETPSLTANTAAARRPSLVINAISNWVSLGVNTFIAFLLTPYLIQRLGAGKYGIWILLVSIIGYSGLLDMGITSAAMRYIARYVGQRDEKLLNETINTSLAIFCIAGLIVIIISLFAAAPLANFFHIKAEDISMFKIAIRLTGISAGLMFPDRVLSVIILAHERFVISNAVKISNIILKGILSILVLFAGGKLVGLSIVFVALGFLTLCINFIIIKTFFRHIRFTFNAVNKTATRLLMSFGFFSLLAQIGVFMSSQLGPAIIGRYCELDMIGVYGVALMVLGYLRRLVISCVGATQPRLAALAGTVDKQEFTNLLMRYSVLISNLAVCTGLVAYFLVKDFFLLWLPSNFPDLESAYQIFFILLLSIVPALMVNILNNALQAINKHSYYAYQSIGEGIVSLILSVVMVQRYGVVGVAVGMTVPSLLANIVIQPIYCSHFIQFSWLKYILRVVIKPLALAGTIIVISRTAVSDFSAMSYMQLILKGIGVAFVYAFPAYWLCVDKITRELIALKLKGFIYSFSFLNSPIIKRE